MELSLKATGKLIYLSIGGRSLKYNKEVGRAFAEAEESRHDVVEDSCEVFGGLEECWYVEWCRTSIWCTTSSWTTRCASRQRLACLPGHQNEYARVDPGSE